MPNNGRRDGVAEKVSNAILSATAGLASFLFTLAAVFLMSTFSFKLMASLTAGLFCLVICWIAGERPNSEGAKATKALIRRLLAVRDGDYQSPVPEQVMTGMPALGEAAERLFAEVRASIAQARAIALFDPVTKLPNRLHFRSEAEAQLTVREDGRMAAMFFIDLDRFKAVNDNLGHARGDELLVMVADRLQLIAAEEVLRAGGSPPLVARLAGDEFTMYAPFVEDVEEAQRIGGRLLTAMTDPFTIRGQSIDIGASIGVSLAPRHGGDVTTLMRASDIAMYQAKENGRGQVVLFSDDLADEFERRAAVQAGLRDALTNEEFELAFQPQVNLDGEVTTVEALVRWRHPEDGIRFPTSFISVAEECGLINDLGDWVARAVAGTLGRWSELGIPIRIALNVSPRQLDRTQFFPRLTEMMRQANAPLNRLELEFTEGAAMEMNPGTISAIANLRADGVRIALDDFGTGYSNLARLKTLPIDRIKIDKSLVQDIHLDCDARTIVQGVVQIVHGIGCEAVGEGVEIAAQADVLRVIGCDALQGFAYCHPLGEADLFAWLAAREGLSPPLQVERATRRIVSA